MSKDIYNSSIHDSKILEITQMLRDTKEDKSWYIYTLEYYTAVRMNEPHIHNTIGIHVSNIILSEKACPKRLFIMIAF